jgi:Bacterial Ig-like domain (group 2)
LPTIQRFRPLKMFLCGPAAVSLFLLSDCGGGSSPTVVPSPPAVVSSILVSPINGSVTITQTQQFTATAIFTDGTKHDVTGSVSWASSDPTVATVEAAGLVHGISRGTTNLSASLNQKTGTTPISSGGGILMKLPMENDFAPPTLPQISAGGRFVIFQSGLQIYEQDTCIGVDQGCTPQAKLVSVSSSGEPITGTFATMSSDGRFVAFNSGVLSSGSAAPAPLYLRDTCVGPTAVSTCVPTTTLVSVAPDGTPLSVFLSGGVFSLDGVGRFVFFLAIDPSSDPTALPCFAVYARDTCNLAGSTCTASTSNLGQLCSVSGKVTYDPHLGKTSGDGRYLTTFTPFICGPHAGGFGRIDVVDTCSGVAGCTVASVFTLPTAPDCSVGSGPSLSGTGRFLSFSADVQLGLGCATCVYDQCTGAPNSCRKGYTEAGIDANGNPLGSGNPIISADGRFVAISASTYRDTCLEAPGPCTPETVTIPLVYQNSAVTATDFYSMSSDARYVVFESSGGNGEPTPVYIAITGLNLP